ncbi:MerR family transcriptional regulator [Streptomyces iconiensis]|uniref:MerR family transcriptional regulator n=1 Tax=Streptomyces iconiensis TaxID=1384038 RepID=A0ABT6ZSC4_9ACTN|nr:MerR family transcriptional regulator [Streptomyces iconiensis]MDJ1131950.1 MerR family transcriptional regulator [Streptomyces iconiensis]
MDLRNRKKEAVVVDEGYAVGQVAGFAGVSVRTLHHYDEIGLLAPSRRTAAAHRRYTDADLDRLQRILFYRELGFPLEEIAALLDDSLGAPPDRRLGEDPHGHLRRQHELLTERIDRLRTMAAAVERAMEARKMGINLTPEEKFEVFGDFDPDAHLEEAERRWGNSGTGESNAFQESRRRTARYTKDDWKAFKEEMDGIHQRIAGLLAAGVPADAPEAMGLAEEHRLFIARTSYACGHGMHVQLGEMYVADERFTATYEAIREGLAVYMRDVIAANAEDATRTGRRV